MNNDNLTELMIALQPLLNAINKNDRDTISGLKPDDTVIWCARSSWGYDVDLTLGHLRAIKIAHNKLVKQAKLILESKWDSEGACDSCGYHACLYEYHLNDLDIWEALYYEDGLLHLPCYSDDEDSDSHRGVNIKIIEISKNDELKD